MITLALEIIPHPYLLSRFSINLFHNSNHVMHLSGVKVFFTKYFKLLMNCSFNNWFLCKKSVTNLVLETQTLVFQDSLQIMYKAYSSAPSLCFIMGLESVIKMGFPPRVWPLGLERKGKYGLVALMWIGVIKEMEALCGGCRGKMKKLYIVLGL